MASVFREIEHEVDFCVVGGGLAGMFAAISAARHGAKVALMHDRPVFGGNASSEIRMWIRGAHGENNKETGLIEEIDLENIYRNPSSNYSIWDSILYEKVRFEPNITLLMNCSCNDAEMDGSSLKSIKGWQLTTQTWHIVKAKLFADCSGDSILAPLTGADVRWGREEKAEFDEDIAPEIKDNRTMGLSCLLEGREMTEKREFIAPTWARKFSKEHLPHRMPNMKSAYENYWYIELGGQNDTIHDAEDLRDELLKVSFGIWDYIKNSGDCDADNWDLEWAGFLPGKRENRRYVGDYIMTQNDIRSEGRFEDIVAYGGWSMDDHHPDGINHPGQPTTFHHAPSPYGIAYRCLYSSNVDNLFCAGRNISATHAALSSTRVMATCAIIGQAVGTAAYIASKNNTTPRGVYQNHLDELQQTIMNDDCYLPWKKREVSELTKNAKITSSGTNSEAVRNGVDRTVGNEANKWTGSTGSYIEYRFEKVEKISELRFVFDSDIDRLTVAEKGPFRSFSMRCNIRLADKPLNVPKTLVKKFRVEALNDDGKYETILQIDNNHQRLVKAIVDVTASALRFVPEETWGCEIASVYAWDVK